MTVSINVLRKVQEYYDKRGYKDLLGEAGVNAYLDACIDFGFMTKEESEELYIKLLRGEHIYELQPSQ